MLALAIALAAAVYYHVNRPAPPIIKVIPLPLEMMKLDPRIYAPGGIKLKPWEDYA